MESSSSDLTGTSSAAFPVNLVEERQKKRSGGVT